MLGTMAGSRVAAWAALASCATLAAAAEQGATQEYMIRSTCTASSGKYKAEEPCFDNYDYIGRDGYTCAAWRADDCATANDPSTVFKNCPFSCGLCTPNECEDNADFTDPSGYGCDSWEGYECGAAVNLFGFSFSQMTMLLQNCPKACKFCGDQSDDGCTFPFYASGQKHARCHFDTSGGYEWCRGPRVDADSGEAQWKACVPSGTPCVFPFVHEGETYNTCAIQDGKAWCPTKVSAEDNTVVDGHWTFCDCNVTKDFIKVPITTTSTVTTKTTTFTMPQWVVAVEELPLCDDATTATSPQETTTVAGDTTTVAGDTTTVAPDTSSTTTRQQATTTKHGGDDKGMGGNDDKNNNNKDKDNNKNQENNKNKDNNKNQGKSARLRRENKDKDNGKAKSYTGSKNLQESGTLAGWTFYNADGQRCRPATWQAPATEEPDMVVTVATVADTKAAETTTAPAVTTVGAAANGGNKDDSNKADSKDGKDDNKGGKDDNKKDGDDKGGKDDNKGGGKDDNKGGGKDDNNKKTDDNKDAGSDGDGAGAGDDKGMGGNAVTAATTRTKRHYEATAKVNIMLEEVEGADTAPVFDTASIAAISALGAVLAGLVAMYVVRSYRATHSYESLLKKKDKKGRLGDGKRAFYDSTVAEHLESHSH